jgi:hypothetical protein
MLANLKDKEKSSWWNNDEGALAKSYVERMMNLPPGKGRSMFMTTVVYQHVRDCNEEEDSYGQCECSRIVHDIFTALGVCEEE